MIKKHCISWILAGVVTSLLMTQFSAMAADKVVVIPLFGSGDEIPTVKSKTGRIWMDRNLGAIRVAGSKSDSLAYGWLYQWGRPADGHESRTSPVTSLNDLSNDVVPGHGHFITVNTYPNDWLSPQNNDLWEVESGVNNPCPPGFRIPTQEDWDKEVVTWDSPDAEGAFKSALKLTLASHRSPLGAPPPQSYCGFYWTQNTEGVYSIALQICDGTPSSNGFWQYLNKLRADASSVRCIQN